jgi:hypothetical protein
MLFLGCRAHDCAPASQETKRMDRDGARRIWNNATAQTKKPARGGLSATARIT